MKRIDGLTGKLIGAAVGLAGLAAPTQAHAQQADTEYCFDQQPSQQRLDTTPRHYEPVTEDGVAQSVSVTKNGEPLSTLTLAQSPTNTPDSTAERIANTPEDVINATRGPYASIAGDASTIDSQIESRVDQSVKDDIAAHLAYVKTNDECTTTSITADDITTSFSNDGYLTDINVQTDKPRHLAGSHPGIVYNSMDDTATPAFFAKGGQIGNQPARALIRDIDRPQYDNLTTSTTTDTVVVTETETKRDTVTTTKTDTVTTDDGTSLTLGAGYTSGPGVTASAGVDNLGDFSVTLAADYALPNTETQRETDAVRGPLPTDLEQGGLTFPEGSYVQPVSQSQETTSSIGANILAGYDVSDHVELQAGPGLTMQTTETTGKEYLRGDVTEELATSTDATYKNKKDPLGGPYKESNTEFQPTLEARVNARLDNGLGVTGGANYNVSTEEVTPEVSLQYNF